MTRRPDQYPVIREDTSAPTNVLDRVTDKTGRLDCLFYGIVGRIAENSTHPLAKAAYSRFRNPIAEFLHDNLGPIEPRETKPKSKRKRRRSANPANRSRKSRGTQR